MCRRLDTLRRSRQEARSSRLQRDYDVPVLRPSLQSEGQVMRGFISLVAFSLLASVAGPSAGYDYGSYGYPGYGQYPAPPMPQMPHGPYASTGRQSGMEKGVTDEGYTLRIHTAPRRPQDIEVTADRGILVVRSVRSDQTDYRREGGYSYRRSFSSFHRRLQLPGDADPGRMVRTDGDGVIDILIPRAQ